MYYFINYKKYTTLMHDVNYRENCTGEEIYENTALFAHFFSISKTALQNKIY